MTLVAATIAGLFAASSVLRHHPVVRRPGGPGGGDPGALPLADRLQRCLDRVQPGRRRTRRDAQLPELLDRLAASIRSGRSVGPAMVALHATLPDPLRQDLRRCIDALRHGAPVSEALRTWGCDPGASRHVRLVVAALTVGTGAGGQLGRAVDRTAATLRERHELQGEVHALATQARTSAWVLIGAPVAFASLVGAVEPAATRFLLTTPGGWACLLAGASLDAAAAVWMQRITERAT